MFRIIFTWLSVGLSAVTAVAADAAKAAPDKCAYNLFSPTPTELMRELSPDRPDKTESPYTVDAGHFQLEMDFANYTIDEGHGVKSEAWNVAPLNVKAGLFNNVDLQLVYDNYLNVRAHDTVTGASSRQSGFGDLTTRLKINLWGNDGGTTAFGLLPFLKFPVNTDGLGNSAVEGGLILPLAIQLPYGFDLGLETAFAVLKNENDSDYHGDFINSITVGHNLIGKLDGYMELFSEISTERHAGWIGTIDAGLEYPLGKNIQFDCGCNFGITPAADDFNPFAGLTVRF